MEFINHPQYMNVLRTDCCTCLKGEDNQPISIKVIDCHTSLCLKILLSLKTDNLRHFFKLFRLDEKNHKEEKSRITDYPIQNGKEEILLNFFGIRKSTKEQALAFLRESFNNNNNINYEQKFKENSSVVRLEIVLCENEIPLHHLVHEIHVGNPNNGDLKVKCYTPKTLCDDGEITIKLTNKIKDDNDNVQLEVKGYSSTLVKKFLQPTKDVLVYKVPLNKIESDSFKARLSNQQNHSDYMEFRIKKSEPENLKRKNTSMEGCSNKIMRLSTNDVDKPKEIDLSDNKKRQVNDFLTTKMYREMARTGHDFAVGKEITKKMNEYMGSLPVVYIVQDDVGDTPLNNAILKNNEERANVILDIIYKNFPNEINLKNTSDHTALILSPACDVSLIFIKKLIDFGANLLDCDCDGNTAMNIAIQYKKTEVLMLLLNEVQNQNLTLTNAQLISLVKDILNNDYFDGFELLANYYSILNMFFENEFDENQLMLYKNFVENFEEINNEFTVPLSENSDDEDILDLLSGL